MLHLTMKEGDYLMIGKDIKLIFDKVVSSDKMYIRISAPKTVDILRDKVFERDLAEMINNSEAAPDETEHMEDMLKMLKKEKARQKVEYYKQKSYRRHEEKVRKEKEDQKVI